DEPALERELRARLAYDGSIKLSSIKPAKFREKMLLVLRRDGFEVSKTVVRRPVAEQLADALAHGALIPVKALAAHVRGATSPELKAAIAAAVKAGVARRVVRGREDALCGAEVAVASATALAALEILVRSLGSALKK